MTNHLYNTYIAGIGKRNIMAYLHVIVGDEPWS